MKPDKSHFAEGIALANTLFYRGVPLTSFDRDELLAIAAFGWTAYNRHLQDSINTLESIRSFRK